MFLQKHFDYINKKTVFLPTLHSLAQFNLHTIINNNYGF